MKLGRQCAVIKSFFIDLTLFCFVHGPECSKKLQKEDPFDIFVFDLTSSPDDDSHDVLAPKPASPKTAPTHAPDRPHITRSQAKNLISSETKSSTSSAKSSENMTKMQRNISAVSQLHDKFSKVKEENTCLRGQRTPTSKFKEASRNDSICYGGKNIVNKTPNQPVKTSAKNGAPISKVAQNVSQVKSFDDQVRTCLDIINNCYCLNEKESRM